MKINQNMSAVRANSQLLRTENKLTASVERLSSGYKINKPGDNPAGMAISNKMRAQIRALDQAESNVSDAVSVMQIADGALNEVSSILQRIRELSVQAANGTYCYEDKQSIQAEIDQLAEEVTRISSDTEYNKKTLLDGSSDLRTYATPNSATRIQISNTVASGDYTFNVTESADKAKMSFKTDVLFDATGELKTDYEEEVISLNGISMTLTKGMTQDQFYEELRNTAEQAGASTEWKADGTVLLESTRYGTSAEIAISLSDNLYTKMAVKDAADEDIDKQNAKLNPETNRMELTVFGENAEVSFSDKKNPDGSYASGFTSSATVTTDGNRIKITDFNGFSIDFLLDEDYGDENGKAAATEEGNFKLEVTEIGTMTIQTGGNQYQTIDLSIPEVSAEALYLDTVDVTVAGGAVRALSTLDEAMERLNEVRSRIGAFQNRLEYASGSLSETQEDMTSAYSNLIDTDMATEMVEYTQQSVLEQAATSVLTQANDLPEMVLQMLQ
ncbi:MAG: flagellin [Agathobacter sp.]